MEKLQVLMLQLIHNYKNNVGYFITYIHFLKNAPFCWYRITISYLYCSFLIELMQSLFTYDNISGLDNIFTLFILGPFFCR